MERCVAMNIEKFFEVLGTLIAEKNNVKLKSFKIKKVKREVS
jgi:hypothetical protein